MRPIDLNKSPRHTVRRVVLWLLITLLWIGSLPGVAHADTPPGKPAC